MTRDRWRLVIAAVMIYAVVRAAPTVEGMRDLFVACLYFLGAVVAVALAVSIGEMTAVDAGKKWRARMFDACGILHPDGRPCMLPDGHRSLEHATAWTDEPGEGIRIECRHRFDDTGDRVERRYGRGQLAKVLQTGDVAAPVSAK